jgi:hypothetical protein
MQSRNLFSSASQVLAGFLRASASTTERYSLPGVWPVSSVVLSPVCYTTSTTTTRWRSTRRLRWRQWSCSCELAAKCAAVPEGGLTGKRVSAVAWVPAAVAMR